MASSYTPNPFSFAPEQLRQVINPWSWMTSGTAQIGLFNVAQTASAKPELEAEIVKNVAGYGRQLGRISDLLQLFLREPDRSQWSSADQSVVDDFLKMVHQIAAVKANYLAPTDENIGKLVDGIDCLKDVDRAEYDRLRAAVKARLFPETEPPAIPVASASRGPTRAR